MNNSSSPVKHNWKLVKEFFNCDKTMAIRITADELPPKFEGAIPLTHYTLELVRIHNDRSLRNFPVFCAVVNGVVSVEVFPCDEFVELMHEAHEWVREKRQEREDMLMERKILKEKISAEMGKVAVRGLGTLAKEDAAKKVVKV